MAYTRINRLLTVVGICSCLALSCPGLWAAQSGCSEELPSATASPASGLTVYIDPQTGELLEEPPPGADFQPEVPAAAEEEPVEEVLPDGTVLLRLSEREMPLLQAEIIEGEVVTCHQQPGQDGQTDDH